MRELKQTNYASIPLRYNQCQAYPLVGVHGRNSNYNLPK